MTSRQDSLRPPERAGDRQSSDQLASPGGLPSGLPGLALIPFLELARRLYRWERLKLGLAARTARLRDQVGKVPRRGVGAMLKQIDPALDRRIADRRAPGRELVIGDFDQDGGVAPRFGPIAGVPAIAKESFMPRRGCPVMLVDLGGRLGVRKQFGSSARFVQELEAMVALEPAGCAIPRLMNVNWNAPWITSEFIPGDVVRELLAAAGADIRDRDSSEPPGRRREARRVRAGRVLVPEVMRPAQVAAVAAALDRIHRAGFALEDIKSGNIILRANSGEPVFIDLERALALAPLPRLLAAYLRAIDRRKLRDHLGDWHELGPAGA